MDHTSNLEDADFFLDVMNAFHSWCLGWLRLQDNFDFDSIQDDGMKSMLEENVQEGQQQSTQLQATNLRAIWIKHMDTEDEVPRRRRLQKQRSISSLQETGVGSFDHLNGLSLEQLQDMERLVHDHDSNSCYGTATTNKRSFLPDLDWLDTLCT